MRRLICILLVLMLSLSVCPASAAILPQEPTRYTFSVGHLALEEAAAHGEPVEIEASVQLNETSLLPEISLEAVQAIVNQVRLKGVIQARENGGGMDWTLLVGEKNAGSVFQRLEDDCVTLQMGDTAICALPQELSVLGPLAEVLAQTEYEDLIQKKQPFLRLIEEEVRKIWGLASPFVKDNDHLSVSSGSTSHGITYQIDNEAFHQIMEAWVLQLPEEVPQVLKTKLEDFAFNAEMRNTMKFNLTYGEGDMLRSARGSGTIRYQGKSAGFSFRYSASASSTRITRSWRLTYEPEKGDTMNLNLTTLTSSSGNGRAAQETDLSVTGKWDDHTYRIRFKTDFLNRYELSDEGLAELITGTLSASVKYAGDVLFQVDAKRNGNTQKSGQDAVASETWTGQILSGEEVLFDGAVSLEMKNGGSGLKEPLKVPIALFVEDETGFEQVCALWRESAKQVRQAFLDALDDETVQLMLKAY